MDPWPIHNGRNYQPTHELRALHLEDVTPDQAREIDRLYDQLLADSEKVRNRHPTETLIRRLDRLARSTRHTTSTRFPSMGRKRAQAHGVIFGRPRKLTPHQRREAIARRDAGETLTDIAGSYTVSHSTTSRLR